VKVLGQTVGYLSREFAGRYRQAVLTELGNMPAITVRASITGGQQDKGKLYEYSVELDLAEPLRLEPKTASDPEIVRHNGFGQLSPAGVDAWQVEVWIPVADRGELDSQLQVLMWTTAQWDTVNFYVRNQQRIGLGFKIFELPKDEYDQRFADHAPLLKLVLGTGRQGILCASKGSRPPAA
jgi:hypothetical protein